jgi:hypothetical protein
MIKGRMFGAWVDTGTRDNGYDEDDLIENPVYIAESILRDEIFVERDLTITTKTARNTMTIDGLLSADDDYYNGAYLVNATQKFVEIITDYTGATKTVTVSGDEDEIDANDNVFITKIQGDNKIDITSFDAAGNTADGLRDGWIFGRSVYEKENARSLLGSLCFESHSILNFSNQVYRFIPLDNGTEVATWTSIAYDAGREGISSALTPLENVYTSFRLKYNYDYGKGDYKKEWFVDGNGYTSGGASLGATEQGLCSDAKTNYKITNPFEYGCAWIYDDATAEKLLIKLVNWFTKQRWLVSITQTFKDYCQYDIGDLVKINYPAYIPNALNNSSKFMIYGKNIVETKGRSYINFNLMEI